MNDYDYQAMHEAAGMPEKDTRSSDEYLIKTINRPITVHVFNRQVIIVCNDGTVLTIARR